MPHKKRMASFFSGTKNNFISTILTSLVVATIPIFLFSRDGNDLGAKLIESLMPLNQYYLYAMLSLLVVTVVTHTYNNTKDKKARVKTSQASSNNLFKATLAHHCVKLYRGFMSKLVHCSSVMMDTFISLSSAMAGIYYALLIQIPLTNADTSVVEYLSYFVSSIAFTGIASAATALANNLKQ